MNSSNIVPVSIIMIALCHCADSRDGHSSVTVTPAAPSLLSAQPEATRLSMSRARFAGGVLSVVRIREASPVPGGFRELHENHAYVLPSAVELNASVLASDDRAVGSIVRMRSPGEVTCVPAEDTPRNGACFEYNFQSSEFHADEMWLLQLRPFGSGLNAGFQCIMGGYRIPAGADPNVVLASAREYVAAR